MKLLFEIDTKDYKKDGKAFVRPSVRAIIIQGGKVAMVHSLKYDYYKFPGGGIEDGETLLDALIRETAEEAGLAIDESSVKEFGYVHRVQKSDRVDVDLFVQENYYYVCGVKSEAVPQRLDGYEAEEGFTLEFVEAAHAIATNRGGNHGPKDRNMLEREARVLELLLEEGLV